MNNKNLIAALVKAQSEISPPGKNGTNPVFKSKYATLDNILNAIRKPLSENGLAISQSVEHKDGTFFLVTTMFHVSGESISNAFPMVLEKVTNQGMGSARTYACRYGLCSLLSIPSDEDDDANHADGERPVVSSSKKELITEIFNIIGEDQGKRKWVLSQNSKFYKTEFTSFDQMTESQLSGVVNYLKKSTGVA